jgi:hypothetical protein
MTRGSSPRAQARRLDLLCRAARLAGDRELLRRLEAQLEKEGKRLDARQYDWSAHEPYHSLRQIETAIILKPPISSTEKGVLFVPAEYQLARLARFCDPDLLAEMYLLVTCPTSSPPHSPPIVAFPRLFRSPIFSLVSHPSEIETLPRIASNYVPVPLLAANWVNPGVFKTHLGKRKDIDIIVLADFGRHKRHHVLFRALQAMPLNTSVVLAGRDDGRGSLARLMDCADAYGVSQRFRLLQNPPQETLLKCLATARVSLILSRREGACVAVVESLFANTPVGLMEGALIGSSQWINNETGRFLDENGLAEQLIDFVAESSRYRPRAWALEAGLDCFTSTQRLNAVLKSHLTAAGQSWTRDIVPHHWRPAPEYTAIEDQTATLAARTDVLTHLGFRTGPESSWAKS